MGSLAKGRNSMVPELKSFAIKAVSDMTHIKVTMNLSAKQLEMFLDQVLKYGTAHRSIVDPDVDSEGVFYLQEIEND